MFCARSRSRNWEEPLMDVKRNTQTSGAVLRNNGSCYRVSALSVVPAVAPPLQQVDTLFELFQGR